MRAALYARISLDRKDGAGVGRQLADCRAAAESRGWDVVAEFTDNDASAFQRKKRPAFEEMLVAAEAGGFDVLVAWHADRLYRRLSDLERFGDVMQSSKVEVLTVRGGDMDLSSATGRMVAGIIGSVARGEAEAMGERVSRAKKALAAEGRPPGGGMRAFGYEADKVTIVPAEADLIRAAAERVAAGGSVYEVAREWNAAGWATTGGRPWRVTTVRRTLTSPRTAGLRAYKGEIVGPAIWPAIVDMDTWDRLRAMSAGRVGAVTRRNEWLLSGMIACPHCGNVLYGSRSAVASAYRCSPDGAAPGSCGGASIASEHADRRVSQTIEVMFGEAAPLVAASLAERGTPNITAELDAIDATRIGLAQRWAAGSLSDAEYDAARSVLTARSDALDQPAPRYPVAVNLPDLRGAWERGTVEAKRAVIRSLVRLPIQLAPGRAVNPGDRLTITPVWD